MPRQHADATPRRKLEAWARWTVLMPWIVFAICLLVTWQLWRNAQQEAEQNLYKDFQAQVDDSSRRITQRMLDYEQVLAGVRGFFAASTKVERSEFRAFVAALDIEKTFPGVQSVGWVKMIPHAEKAAYIAAMRHEGFGDFTILPPGDRDLYAVVIYVEPFFGRNTRAFGQDHYAEPVRRATIDQARDLGAVRISGKVKLAQETDRRVQAGFQMAMPVYKTGLPPATLAERREQFVGLVGSSFRMDDLMRGILGAHPLDNDVDLEIYDGETISEFHLMHNTDDVVQGNNPAGARFQIIRRLNIAGHPWTLVAHSLPGFVTRLDNTKAYLIAGAGIGTGALLGLLTWLFLRGRASALKTALEISASEARLRSILDTAMDAVIQMNAEGDITGWSGQAAAMFGWTREEALGRALHTLIIPPQYRAPHLQGMSHFRNTGEASVLNKSIETLALRRDGSEFHVELTVSMVCWEGKFEFCAFISDMTQKKAAAQELEANYVQLAHLERQHATDEERQRIMRDLHDGLGSQLFVTLSRVERGEIDGDRVGQALRECIADLRLALEAMNPEGNDFMEVWSSFHFRWKAQLATVHVSSTWDSDEAENPIEMAPQTSLHLLRIVQEALTNVVKHARARHVSVHLSRLEGQLRIEIHDDGIGLGGSESRTGHGLNNMYTRATRIGATLIITAATPGTRVSVSYPL